MDNKRVEINAIIISTRQDKDFKEQLALHLRILKLQGYLANWYDREVSHLASPGSESSWESMTADIILAVVSPDFLASGYLDSWEFSKILERQSADDLDVIPVILSPCDWKNTSLSRFVPLPEGGKPIMDINYWYSRDAALTSMMKVLKEKIRQRNTKEKTLRIQPPGGVLMPNSFNYIERPVDNQLMMLSGSNTAPMCLISGGIQTGKTSLIFRFLKEIKMHKGNRTINVDFAHLLNVKNNPDIRDMFYFIVDKATEEFSKGKTGDHSLESAVDDSTIVDWAREAFKRILEHNINNGDRVFLVIDSIDELLQQVTGASWVVRWLEILRSYQGTTPFDRLTVIAVLSLSNFSPVFLSPLKSQAHSIMVGNFEGEKIKELLELLMPGNKQNNENALDIFRLFAGHPHLSHLAVYALYSGSTIGRVRSDAQNLFGAYGSYWRRIEHRLELLVKNEKNRQPVLFLFKALMSEARRGNETRIINKYLEPLYILGIVDGEGQVTSEFIKEAILKELRINEAL